MTSAGSEIMPIAPPTTVNSSQLHAGTPSQGVACVTYATSFEANAATIPPEKKPTGTMKQPIARVRHHGVPRPAGVSGAAFILATAPACR